tara:strand:+ start:311 stop:448 length:138 start_codon:yes stop_codon:yes gene_type:complete
LVNDVKVYAQPSEKALKEATASQIAEGQELFAVKTTTDEDGNVAE